MAATTEDRTEAPDPRDDWPEGYREWLEDLPDDVEHELSDLLDAMEGIKSLADTAILIHQNTEGGPVGDPEPGELEHRQARIIAPMREDAARAVWALYRRLDAFFGLWREYSVAADRGAFRLASEAENGDGPGAGADYDHPRGVFNQKYGGPNGDEVLVAVDRSGRSLVRTFVPDGADRDAVVRTMKRLLRNLEGAA